MITLGLNFLHITTITATENNLLVHRAQDFVFLIFKKNYLFSLEANYSIVVVEIASN